MTDDRKGVGHTPGPWEIVPGDEWTTDVGTPDGEHDDGRKRHWNVASVNRLRDEWEANRRLIAAAPTYYEGAEAFIAYEAAMEVGDEVAAMLAYAKAADLLKAAHSAATGAAP